MQVDAVYANGVLRPVQPLDLTEHERVTIEILKADSGLLSAQLDLDTTPTRPLRQFREDVVTKKFAVFAIRESEFAMAERLVEQYAFDMRLRALDALQLAVALGLRQQGRSSFVASRRILIRLTPTKVGFGQGRPLLDSSSVALPLCIGGLPDGLSGRALRMLA